MHSFYTSNKTVEIILTMKTTLIILSFLLFAFASTSFPEAVDALDSQSVVTDVSGNEVVTGKDYYIYSSPFSNNSITAATIAGLSVVFSTSTKIAYKVVISSPYESQGSPVHLDTNLNFKLNYKSPSNTSTTWGVSLDALLRQFAVRIGGDESYYFKIEKYESNSNVYKLLYCPTGRHFCQCNCVEVGYEPRRELLYMTPNRGKSLPIMFSPLIQPRISQVV